MFTYPIGSKPSSVYTVENLKNLQKQNLKDPSFTVLGVSWLASDLLRTSHNLSPDPPRTSPHSRTSDPKPSPPPRTSGTSRTCRASEPPQNLSEAPQNLTQNFQGPLQNLGFLAHASSSSPGLSSSATNEKDLTSAFASSIHNRARSVDVFDAPCPRSLSTPLVARPVGSRECAGDGDAQRVAVLPTLLGICRVAPDGWLAVRVAAVV